MHGANAGELGPCPSSLTQSLDEAWPEAMSRIRKDVDEQLRDELCTAHRIIEEQTNEIEGLRKDSDKVYADYKVERACRLEAEESLTRLKGKAKETVGATTTRRRGPPHRRQRGRQIAHLLAHGWLPMCHPRKTRALRPRLPSKSKIMIRSHRSPQKTIRTIRITGTPMTTMSVIAMVTELLTPLNGVARPRTTAHVALNTSLWINRTSPNHRWHHYQCLSPARCLTRWARQPPSLPLVQCGTGSTSAGSMIPALKNFTSNRVRCWPRTGRWPNTWPTTASVAASSKLRSLVSSPWKTHSPLTSSIGSATGLGTQVGFLHPSVRMGSAG